MPAFEWPSAISARTSRSRSRQLVERALLARPAHEPGDDRRVEHALAVGDAAERVDEHGDVRHALLQQVAATLRVLLEQAHRVARLDVVGQDEHADARRASTRICCAATRPSSVCVGGIRMSTIATSGRVSATRRRSSSAVPALPTTSKPASSSSRSEPLAEEGLVVGDHDPHGSSARMVTRPSRRVDGEAAVERADPILERDEVGARRAFRLDARRPARRRRARPGPSTAPVAARAASATTS